MTQSSRTTTRWVIRRQAVEQADGRGVRWLYFRGDIFWGKGPRTAKEFMTKGAAEKAAMRKVFRDPSWTGELEVVRITRRLETQ